MRVAGYILLVVATTAFVIASGIVAASYGSSDDGWHLVFMSFGAVAVIVGPLVLYAVLGFWDVHRSTSANVSYRRYRLFAIASTVVGAILFAMWGIIAGAPWWVVGLFIAVGVALLGGVIAAGPQLQLDLSRRPAPASRPWELVTRAQIRRVGRASLISGSVAFVIAAAAGASLLISFDAVSEWPIGVLGVVYVTVLAAVIPVFVANFRLTKLIRETLDGDMGLARKFARVVVKHKPDDLTEGEQRMAARWASLVWLLLVGQLVVQIPILLFVVVLPLSRFLSGDQDPVQNIFPIIIVAAFAFMVAYAVPVTIRSVLRARRYAEQHVSLIPSE